MNGQSYQAAEWLPLTGGSLEETHPDSVSRFGPVPIHFSAKVSSSRFDAIEVRAVGFQRCTMMIHDLRNALVAWNFTTSQGTPGVYRNIPQHMQTVVKF